MSDDQADEVLRALADIPAPWAQRGVLCRPAEESAGDTAPSSVILRRSENTLWLRHLADCAPTCPGHPVDIEHFVDWYQPANTNHPEPMELDPCPNPTTDSTSP